VLLVVEREPGKRGGNPHCNGECERRASSKIHRFPDRNKGVTAYITVYSIAISDRFE
jgi:hypothetical protein